MLWTALLLPHQSPDRSSRSSAGTPELDDSLPGLAAWALQFTPRVSIVEEAVIMEVQASTRLFGGRRALRDLVLRESAELGVASIAWAPTSLAAIALARAGKENGLRCPIEELLAPLPMETLSAARPHFTTLAQLGCKTIGDLRALPRGGLGRRFGQGLLDALDQAHGLRPEVHAWVQVPETFKARLELMARVETAPALLFGARRLLVQMCGWLMARQAGTTSFVLRWAHDTMRSRNAGDGGSLVIRTATPMREVDHLCRLLAEHLARVELAAPAGDLELEALDVHPMQGRSASLLPDPACNGEALERVLERLAARLGPERVLRPAVVEDHRVECMQHWQPATASLPGKKAARRIRIPQPTFVLPEPLRLIMNGERPTYQGALHLLIGPHRVEGGWWHRIADDGTQRNCNVVRDYWVAWSERHGVLWVFHDRRTRDAAAWYLHGIFA